MTLPSIFLLGIVIYLSKEVPPSHGPIDGLLMLTLLERVQDTGHAFYTEPIRFKDSPNDTVSSFSTTFVFAIHSQIPILRGHGLAFVIAPNPDLRFANPSQYLGLFNISTNGNDTSHVFAVELDTIMSTEFGDTNDNHVGIDINSLTSVESSPAGYWDEKGQFKNLNLISRKQMQVWVDYDGPTNQMDVIMAPFRKDKPRKPLVSIVRDLSSVLLQDMYVGFSSATSSSCVRTLCSWVEFPVEGGSSAIGLIVTSEIASVGLKTHESLQLLQELDAVDFPLVDSPLAYYLPRALHLEEEEKIR